MTSSELKTKFNLLKDSLDQLKLDEARAETTLKNLEKQKEDKLKEILELSETTTVEDAEKKLVELGDIVDKFLNQAEAILNENNQ